jgi:hypothetical protein
VYLPTVRFNLKSFEASLGFHGQATTVDAPGQAEGMAMIVCRGESMNEALLAVNDRLTDYDN